MPRAFVIETSRITAGIVTCEPAGFLFHATHPEMVVLEGTLHHSPHAARRAAEQVAASCERHATPRGKRAR